MISENRSRDWLAPAAAVALTLCCIVITYRLCIRDTAGVFVYPLDDSYIHLAIAKHLAQSGVWGTSSHHFASASSSVLWPLLVAGIFKIVGVHTRVPLILSSLSGLILLCTADGALRSVAHFRALPRFFLLLAIIFFTPVIPNSFVGMEHLTHACVAVGYCWLVADELYAPTRYGVVGCVAMSALVTGLRYEGIAMVGLASLLFVTEHRWIPAIAQALAGAAPVVIFGFYAISHGAYFFPNSILLKSNVSPISLMFSRFYESIPQAPELWLLLLLSVILLALLGRSSSKSKGAIWLALFTATALLQLIGGQVGWYYRYQAYLNALGIVAVAIGCAAVPRQSWQEIREACLRPVGAILVGLTAVAAMVLAAKACVHSEHALTTVPQVTKERYLEHIQMARFIERFYPDSAVVVNDVGAISYFTDARVLDLFGLSSIEPVRLRLAKQFDAAHVRAWVTRENAEIAIIQTQLWRDRSFFPPEWIKVGEWVLPSNIVSGDTRIDIYALQESQVPYIRESLIQFRSDSPSQLKQVLEPLPSGNSGL